MLSFLLYLLILLLPLGELARLDLGNSIVIKPLDFVAVLILIFSIVFYRKNFLALVHPLMKSLYVFIFFALVSLAVNVPFLKPIQLAAAFMYLLRFVSYVSIFFAVYFSSKKTKKRINFMVFLASALIIFMGFIQFAYYTNLVNLSYLGWDQHWWRLYATFFDPNFAGVYLVIFLMFCLGKAILAKNPRTKILLFFLTFITLVAIILTFSRSAFLALLAGLFAFLFFSKYPKKTIVILLSIFAVGIILILTHSSNQYTEGTKLFRPVSSIARIKSLEAGFYVFSREPVFGVGFNAYRYAQLRFGTANSANWEISHSNAGIDDSFLFVLGTTGIIGFFAFLLFLKKLFEITYKNIIAFSTLLVICTGSLFINAFFFSEIMAIAWIVWGLTTD